MVRVLDRVCAFLAILAALLFLFMTFTICYSIITRATGIPTPVWTVQLNEYAMLWMTFLGTAWLLAKNRHVSIQIFVSRLNKKGKKVFQTIHDFMGLLLCATICYFGALTTWDHYQRNVIDVQVIDVPKALVIIVIPVGFLLLALQFIRRIAEDLRGGESDGTKTGLAGAASKAEKSQSETTFHRVEG
ncbi:MAG: TRAP transporter small permease [Desulfobacterales bacterium]|nr:TRAP transporter small permease [Desulfobacterales bacterium]